MMLIEHTDSSVTPNVPTIVTADIQPFSEDPEDNVRGVRFTTGDFVESVRIDRRTFTAGSPGPWLFLEFMDVEPNTANYDSIEINVPGADEIQFRVRPFAGDGMTGQEGPSFETPITSFP
jgi:hypothetical protein